MDVGPRALLGASERLHRFGTQFVQVCGERQKQLRRRERVSQRVMRSMNGERQALGEIAKRRWSG